MNRPRVVLALLVATSIGGGSIELRSQQVSPSTKRRMIEISQIVVRAEVRMWGKLRRFVDRKTLFEASPTRDLFLSLRQEPLYKEFQSTQGQFTKDYQLEIVIPAKRGDLDVVLIDRKTGMAIRTRPTGEMSEGTVRKDAKGRWLGTTFRQRPTSGKSKEM